MTPVRAAIVGLTGYTGQELLRLLIAHPRADVVGLFGSAERDHSEPLAEAAPALGGVCDLPVEPGTPDAIRASRPDAIFLATPHEASARLAPDLLATATVLDLSGAFRLDRDAYPQHYGFAHPAPELLGEAVYGLVERTRTEIARADLIALPGCYATAAILALAPLVDAGLLDRAQPPIIDAISGVTGAGRAARPQTSFCEVSARPYGVLNHRHQPEIERHAGAPVRFVPHLGPWDRGILATTHAQLAGTTTEADVRSALETAYTHEPFVRMLPEGRWPEINHVQRTNFCDIGIIADETGHLVIASALDNLGKGAAGQAVQAMNARFGFDERTALGPTKHVTEGAARA